MNTYPGTLEIERENGLIRFRSEDNELMLVVSVNPAMIREESITLVQDKHCISRRREDL